MRMTRWAACVALLLQGGLHQPVRAAETRLVTVGTDSVDAPAPGSLRHVLLNVAQPGDTIRFAEQFSITLDPKDPILRISEVQTGITIEGPAEIRNGFVLVRGDRTTITGMRFTNVRISAGNPLDLASVLDLRTDDFVFLNNTVAGDSELSLSVTRNARIEDNTFDVRLLYDATAIDDVASEGSRWIHNTWSETSIGGFSEGECADFVFERNGVVGDASFQMRSGRVSNNTFTGSVRVRNADLETDTGPLTIERNTCASLAAHRPDITVDQNTVTGAVSDLGKPKPYPTIVATIKGEKVKIKQQVVKERLVSALSVSIGNLKGDTGYVRVTGNTVTATQGWSLGASVRAAPLVTECRVEGNTVTGGSVISLQVVAEKTATIRGNTVNQGGPTAAIGLYGPASDGWTVEDNSVNAGAADGIYIAKGRGIATLRRNKVKGCEASALSVTGRTFVSEDGTYETSANGVIVGKKTIATIRGGFVRNNRDSGVYADTGSTVEVARTSFSGNGGAGIDLAPVGVTPNTKSKKANRNMGWPTDLVFDEETGRVTGKSEPGARIDAYAVEEGARAGNPANGEGVLWLGETIAAADGTFSFPDAGRAPCPASKKLTFTATRLPAGGITFNARIETSEFSDDVECTGGPQITLVSQNSAGVPGDQPLYDIALAGLRSRNVSDDGRIVVFESKATNLVAGDTNGLIDVFLRDTVAGTTIRVTRTAAGGQIEPSIGVNSEAGIGPSLSSDGRFVVYQTRSDSVSGEDGSNPAVILFDAQTGVNTVVASAKGRIDPYPSGRFSLYDGRGGAISGDGNVVAFSSLGADWVPGDAYDDYDMFVWTRATGAYERITVTSAGGDPQGGNNPANCGHPRLSHDGRFVAFYSNHDLIDGGSGGPNLGVVRVWLRDRQAGTTEIVSLTDTGAPSFGFDPWVSDDGRFVAFESTAAFVAADTNGVEDIYLRDRQTGTTTRVSLDAAGAQRVGRSHSPAMSGDGRFITFLSIGSYTFPGGATVGNINDLFLLDRQTGTLVEAGVGPSGEALGGCFSPRLSRTGSFLYFDTAATNLVDLGGQTFVSHGYLRNIGQ